MKDADASHTVRSATRAGVLAVVAALFLAACSDGSNGVVFDPELGQGPPQVDQVPTLSADTEPADFEVRPSLEQLSVLGAPPETDLALYDEDGTAVDVGTTDDTGALIFREVEPGDGYRVGTAELATVEAPQVSEPVEIVAVEGSTPPQDFYDSQTLEEGFGYIETRDGTTLSASVFLPGPPEDGPYPTVVEYSGYSPSKPATNLIGDRLEDLEGVLPEGIGIEEICTLAPYACEAPDQPGSLLAHALGYAVVGVNMRGTGCSGGAYDYFEPLQLTDGYDVIETVAAQDWVKGGKVGMVGLSYPGISQLFVASTDPPSLAAITPLSVFDDTARGVLAPGGIFNEGFALQWAENVLDDAEPYGQGWEQEVVDGGDETCARNQELRGQNVDVVAKAQSYPTYEPSVADPLNPSLFVQDIDVPVFLTGSWQDEQTGGRFPLLFEEFDNAPVTRFSAWNGAHADGLAPQNLVEWKTFLDLYVADELTPRPAAFDLFAGLVTGEAFGVEMSIPPQRLLGEYPDIESARAAYEAEPNIRILLENGAGDPETPGAPVATTELFFDAWPVPGTTPMPWYFGPDGELAPSPPADDGGASTFEVDPELATTSSFADTEGNDPFLADAEYDWQQEPDGSATVFVSEPLEEDLVLIGSASADLWIRSSHSEADLGVTLSEVRPDGQETYIQSGVLRASHRALAEGSTELLPLHSGLAEDQQPLPEDEFVEARVEVFPFGHVLREGSRIRISVHTPGGDKVRWKYILADHPEGATVDVGHSSEHPSRLVLPRVDGVTGYPEERPACGALRAQPCRTFEEYENEPAG